MYLMILFSYRKKKSKQSFRKKKKKDIAGKIDLINRTAKGKINEADVCQGSLVRLKNPKNNMINNSN